jgi:hypothetical protein
MVFPRPIQGTTRCPVFLSKKYMSIFKHRILMKLLIKVLPMRKKVGIAKEERIGNYQIPYRMCGMDRLDLYSEQRMKETKKPVHTHS